MGQLRVWGALEPWIPELVTVSFLELGLLKLQRAGPRLRPRLVDGHGQLASSSPAAAATAAWGTGSRSPFGRWEGRGGPGGAASGVTVSVSCWMWFSFRSNPIAGI